VGLKTYDPKRVSIKWKGIELNDDTPDGVFISVAKGKDTWALFGGNDTTVRIRMTDDSGVISITVRKSSSVNAKLLAIYNRDRTNEVEVGTMVCSDPSGPGAGSLMVAADAFILAKPPFERSTNDVGSNVWRFGASRIDDEDLGIAPTVGS
jgi:regulation of enolase protein 1 (concanavalin A-like superfamily)